MNPTDYFILYLDLAREIIRTLILLSVTAFFTYLSVFTLYRLIGFLYAALTARRALNEARAELEGAEQKIDEIKCELRELSTLLSSMLHAEYGEVMDGEEFVVWQREQMSALWRVIYDNRSAFTGEKATKEQTATDS
jgi:hypothetical protein